jgi:hypothetical protein
MSGRALCPDNQAIKKAGAKPHRPSRHRFSHQCQYIRGQKQISDFGSRERSRGVLTSNADYLQIVDDCVGFKGAEGCNVDLLAGISAKRGRDRYYSLYWNLP